MQHHLRPLGTDWKYRCSPPAPVHTVSTFGWGSGICVLICSLGNSLAHRDLKISGVDHPGPQIWERGIWDDLRPSSGSLSIHYRLER